MVRQIRTENNRSIAPNYDAAIRQTLQAHASNSKNFEKRADYFEHVTEGRWRLRPTQMNR
jgi:hypothetical protein